MTRCVHKEEAREEAVQGAGHAKQVHSGCSVGCLVSWWMGV